MKLVVDVRLINSSGIGTYIKNVLPRMIDFFREVIVLGDEQELLDFEWSHKVKIINFTPKIYSVIEQIYYPFIIPECNCFWSPHFNIPLLSIKSKIRIVTIHDVNHLSNPSYFNFLKRLWAKILYKNAVKKSSQIITVSEFSKSEILKHFEVKNSKINVIHCGVNQDFNVSEIAESDHVILPDFYFLYVGNVKPHKNLMLLLQAYNQLEKSIKDTYKLVILGKKDGFITKDNKVFDFIARHTLEDNIHFTGYIKDKQISSAYKRATMFIFPSLYEGFGLPILEAMSCGVPILSSDKASLPEVGGEAVVYFDPYNHDELKEKIIGLLKDQSLQSQMIKRGNEQVKKFRWELSVQKHLEIFR